MSERGKLYKTDALVLRSMPFAEADRLLTLLTWEKGKVKAIARGARKTKSQLAAGVEMFTYGHYLLYRGRSFDTVTQHEIKDPLSYLRREPACYAYAVYFAEIVDRLVEEQEPDRALCALLYRVWSALEAADRELLARAFELKLFNLLGYRPCLARCVSCGDSHPSCFSASQGGVLCDRCGLQDSEAFYVSPGTISLASRLLQVSLSKLKVLRLETGQREELKRINRAFLSRLVDTATFRSLPFLEHIISPPDKKSNNAQTKKNDGGEKVGYNPGEN